MFPLYVSKLKWEKQAPPQTQSSIQRVRSDQDTDIPLFPKPKAGKCGVVTPIYLGFTFGNKTEVRLNWSKNPNNQTWGMCNMLVVNCFCGVLGSLRRSYGLLTGTQRTFQHPSLLRLKIIFSGTKPVSLIALSQSVWVTNIKNFHPDWRICGKKQSLHDYSLLWELRAHRIQNFVCEHSKWTHICNGMNVFVED